MKAPKLLQAQTILIVMAVIALLSLSLAGAFALSQATVKMARSTAGLSVAITAADAELENLFDAWRNVMKTVPLGGKIPLDQISSIVEPIPDSKVVNPYLPPSVRFPVTPTLRAVDAFGNVLTANDNATSPGQKAGWPGLFSTNTLFDVRVTAAVTVGNRDVNAVIGRTFTREQTPVFQAAIFFNDDLEIHPGFKMTVNGPVITNGNLKAAGLQGQGLTFGSYVYYRGSYSSYDDPYTLPIYTDSQDVSAARKSGQLAKSPTRMDPVSPEAATALNSDKNNPNVNGGFREIIEKPDLNFTDPEAIHKLRFYTQAAIKVIFHDPQDPKGAIEFRDINDTTIDPNSALVKSFSERNVFSDPKSVYDYREKANVSITDVDLKALGPIIDNMNNSSDPNARFNGILYLTDERTLPAVTKENSNVPTKKAFRLENGQNLPTSTNEDVTAPAIQRGFSIATDDGIYIKGDYNYDSANPSFNPVPSAVLGDSITVLSNNWNDANASSDVTNRKATETTVITAAMSGFIPTKYVNPTTHVKYGDSGGAHNFLRFLEDWSHQNFNFKGSIVELFVSKYFNGPWSVGSTYLPPFRNWTYNENFTRNPSPGLFAATVYSRGTWRRY